MHVKFSKYTYALCTVKLRYCSSVLQIKVDTCILSCIAPRVGLVAWRCDVVDDGILVATNLRTERPHRRQQRKRHPPWGRSFQGAMRSTCEEVHNTRCEQDQPDPMRCKSCESNLCTSAACQCESGVIRHISKLKTHPHKRSVSA